MKDILITGKNSYVGNSFENYIKEYSNQYRVTKISLMNDDWRKIDFSDFDIVFHVAGIAHVPSSKKNDNLYYKVNTDLTKEVAEKAKSDKVKQFIFMSSIIVYGYPNFSEGAINENTPLLPANAYGKSKLKAEKELLKLDDSNFNVVIVRAPMIYGASSKGNYPKLSKLSRLLPIFPKFNNKRSMIYIENLTKFIHLMIQNKERGIFFPQNQEFVTTSNLVDTIAQHHGKEIYFTTIFNPLIELLKKRVGIFQKVFGTLVYDRSLSDYGENYNIKNFKESINMTELNNSRIEILLLCDNGLETVGGEQESTKIILNGIKKDFKVGVIQPGEVQSIDHNIKVYNLSSETRMKHLIKKPVSFLKYINNVRKIINEGKPRVIHSQAQVSFFIVTLLKKLNLINKSIKFIHTERGLYTKYNFFFKMLFKIFLREIDVLVTTTHFNKYFWKKALNQYPNLEFRIIENTAGKLFEEYDEALEKNNEETLTIGFAGRYTEWKNWPLAVDIALNLKKIIGEKLEVRMAVGCLDKESEIKTKKMFKTINETFGDKFKGQININLKDMNKFYYDIDIFVLTSNYNTESFGRTLVEAMSRKTIVLTTNAGGSVEVVGNKDNVLNSSEEFINKILTYYYDKEKMQIEKEQNIKRVKSVYSLENNISKHINLYKENT